MKKSYCIYAKNFVIILSLITIYFWMIFITDYSTDVKKLAPAPFEEYPGIEITI